jgi:hypothetical protein
VTAGSSTATSSSDVRSANLVIDYYDWLPDAIARCAGDPGPNPEPGSFSPGFALPDLDAAVRGFFAAGTAEWRPLAEYAGHRLFLLDLTRNPGTNTVKTLASMLIVARAVEYIRRTGERILIFTPTSANKGIALRDAVERALAAGLATPDQLRIVTLAPRGCHEKFRGGRLANDPELRRLNPVLLYDGPGAEDVKALGRAFVRDHAGGLRARQDTNTWFSLELRNYLVADSARAFFEHDVSPTGAGTNARTHAHAVSSAYGLLGYNVGRDVLEARGLARPEDRPGFLLVQHLGTPDMVLSLRHGSFDLGQVPAFSLNPVTGLYEQCHDPRFPQTTYDPAEVLDPTFYTHQPATSPDMNALIARHGGDGIVVSLAECVARYPHLRTWFEDTDRPLPADFRTIREWSLVMALTGVANAADRMLLPAGCDVVVHASGFYTTADYEPLDAAATIPVETVDDIAAALRVR